MTEQNEEFAIALASMREAIRFANELEGDIGELIPEAFEGNRPEPFLMAEFIMQMLPLPEDVMNVRQKEYWMKVADHMGSDWIVAFRRVGAFMQRTEEFR